MIFPFFYLIPYFKPLTNMEYYFYKTKNMWINKLKDIFKEKSFEEKTNMIAHHLYQGLEGYTIEEQSDAVHKLKALTIDKRKDEITRIRIYLVELETDLEVLCKS